MDVEKLFVWAVTTDMTIRRAVPKFLPTPTNVTVHKGELAVMGCQIKNLGPRLVVWRKASEENPLTIGSDTFLEDTDISVDHEQLSGTKTKWNLMIKNVQLRHAGVYECQISSTGFYTHYVALNVLNVPLRKKPQLVITGTEYVNQYSDIRLTCNATGVTRAPDDVDWFFNGNRIHTSHPRWYGRIELIEHKPLPGRSYISTLIVHLSTVKDQGNYVCRSEDLNVNNMIVHVLNADKDTPIVQRAPVDNRPQQTVDGTSGAGRVTYAVHRLTMVIAVTILWHW